MEKESDILFCVNNHVSKLDDPDTALQIGDSLYAEISEPSVVTPDNSARLEAFLREFPAALSSGNWSDHVDLDSFARYFLINEIFINIDGGEASAYYYLDREEDRLYAGPCWDYDLTFGGTRWIKWISPCCLFMQDRQWYDALWKHEGFREYVKQLYRSEFLPALNDLIEEMPSASKRLEAAARLNSIRWALLFADTREEDNRRFLTERVSFLNSVWVDGAVHCEITFEAPGYTYFPLYVPMNSPGSGIPTPEEMGITEPAVWYREDNGEAFDPASVITEDLKLTLERKH